MYNPVVYFAYWIDSNRMQFPIPVEIHNIFVNDPINPDTYNVLNISNEPEPTRMKDKKVIELSSQFNLILTWDEEILKSCSNAKFFACGMSWIKNPDKYREKIFGVSTVCGTKNVTSNHLLRHELFYRQNEIIIPKAFWNSSHNPMIPVNSDNWSLGPNPEDKIEMFNTMFHIAIENSNYNNYFTEKLLDCFVTRTIPIYVGCPNINDFFNTNGIIQAKGDSYDIIEICNSLSPEIYNQKLEAIEDNYKLCQPYIEDFTDRICKTILEELN